MLNSRCGVIQTKNIKTNFTKSNLILYRNINKSVKIKDLISKQAEVEQSQQTFWSNLKLWYPKKCWFKKNYVPQKCTKIVVPNLFLVYFRLQWLFLDQTNKLIHFRFILCFALFYQPNCLKLCRDKFSNKTEVMVWWLSGLFLHDFNTK